MTCRQDTVPRSRRDDGAIARIPSANKSVMYKQPWTNSQYQLLSVQRSWAKGYRRFPAAIIR